MRIAFVTTDWERVCDEDLDRPWHERACAAAGVRLEHVPWWQPDVDWSAYDLVVLRSPWDYSERLAAFSAWLDRVDGAIPLHNPAAVVRWNLDKRYLADLGAAGVPVVPTDTFASMTPLVDALRRYGSSEVVIKPHVSAGSRHTGRFFADDPRARELAAVILAEAKLVMLQPCVPSVAQRGEVSLVVFDGVVSHAFRKGPLLAAGGGLIGGSYKEQIEPVTPNLAQRAVADAAGAAVARICGDRFALREPLLYARYDIVEQPDGSSALLEAELFEPSFFLDVAPEAAQHFCAAMQRRVQGAVASA